jgi:hypothetical protein
VVTLPSGGWRAPGSQGVDEADGQAVQIGLDRLCQVEKEVFSSMHILWSSYGWSGERVGRGLPVNIELGIRRAYNITSVQSTSQLVRFH